MVAPTIVRNPKALVDAADLFVWIALHGGVDRAKATIVRIEQTLERLAARPRMGRARPDLKGEPRSFSVTPWLIVYEPLKEGDGIHVLRIIDSRRDIAALLGKKT